MICIYIYNVYYLYWSINIFSLISDDDIFSNVSSSSRSKTSNKPSSTAAVKKIETKQVNAFDDPLTGLLGEWKFIYCMYIT